MRISENSENIKIKGYKETWYVVDKKVMKFNFWDETQKTKTVYLLENETYGDMMPWIAVDSKGTVLHNSVYNGFLDLEEMYDYMLNAEEFEAQVAEFNQ